MADGIFMLVDPVKRVCGCVTREQLVSIAEDAVIESDVAHLVARPTRQKRLEFLRKSLGNTLLTERQRKIVQKEIDFLLSEGHEGRSQTLRRAGKTRYVTRDINGVFLGVHDELSARQRWNHVVTMGWTLLVNEAVPIESARMALRATGATSRPSLGDSNRVSASIAAAASLLDGRDNTDVLLDNHEVNVYIDSDESAYSMSLRKVEEAFGVGWFAFDNNSIQVVTGWDSDVIEARIAGKRISSLNQAQRPVQAIGKTNKPKSPKSAPKPHAKADRKSKIEWEQGKVVRDKNGCFLGVMTIQEAMDAWPDARSSHAMIAVPSTVSFADAAVKVAHARDLDIPFVQKRYKVAVESAKRFPREHSNENAEEFWERELDRPVKVYNNISIPIGTVTPRSLQKVLDNGWFLVSEDEAQVMTSMCSGRVKSLLERVREDTPRTDD